MDDSGSHASGGHYASAALERFVEAQAGVYEHALADLERGRKAGHWMWFIFPQIAGLGRSSTAQYYAIADADEAAAYLAHTVLGPRLLACTGAVLSHAATPAEAIFGDIDATKFRSSMTLFDAVSDAPRVFAEALEQFYGGGRDELTLQLLGA